MIVLAWHNPVLLAEQAATLDLLSGGRLDFGIGKGYRYNEFAGFCHAHGGGRRALRRIPRGHAQGVDVGPALVSHRGTYWQFDNVVVEPPTAQKPHPPLWMGAGSAASIRKVAALGFNLLLDQYASFEQIRERIALFRAEVEARGRIFDPMSVGVTRSINIVTTAEDPRARARKPRRGPPAYRSAGAAPGRAGREPGASVRRGDLRLRSLRHAGRGRAHDGDAAEAGAEYVLLNSAGDARLCAGSRAS